MLFKEIEILTEWSALGRLWLLLRRVKQNRYSNPIDWKPTVARTNTKAWQKTEEAVFDHITAQSNADKAWALARLKSLGHTKEEIDIMLSVAEQELTNKAALRAKK